MTHAEKNMVEAYAKLFDGLNAISKLKLIEKLAKSLSKEKLQSNKLFFSSFGAWESDKSAEEIARDIKSARNFRDRNLDF